MWSSRNENVWKGVAYNSAMMVQWALDFLEGWRCANEVAVVSGVSLNVEQWRKPQAGRIKLNTDASVRQGKSRMGLGWVLRDDRGRFMAAKNVLATGNYLVKEVEALCVWEALSWLKVENVKDLASEIGDVEFNFVKRSANCAAHYVAREAFSMSGCGEWLDSPPSFLVNVLHSDSMN
ncbi:PREDICTED: uncharacterized protein LOC109151161 [Ipomoea nil]|uniref:uncharacterized protein LOC109151161 n=1 Tax=Ipomoea nil TaxID=35883 RepID=UPI000901C49C|nr:PREDICTED: uncharacterized protein LOC109151161 [Ipomoea nil]